MSPYQELIDALELNTHSNYQLSQLIGELTDSIDRLTAQGHTPSEVRILVAGLE